MKKKQTIRTVKIEYFEQQLRLAHSRNDLVDNLRFSVLKLFFGFHTVIIGATILKGRADFTTQELLGEASILLPFLSVGVGFALFVVYIRWHIYLYGYKAWIQNLELSLKDLVFGLDNNNTFGEPYHGTYYHDINRSKVKFDYVVVFTLLSMTILNIAVAFVLFKVVEVKDTIKIMSIIFGAILHGVTAPLLLRTIRPSGQK